MAVTDALLSSGGNTVVTLTCCCAVVVLVVTLLKATVDLWRTVRCNRKMAVDFPVPPGGHWLLGHLVMLGPEGGELMLKGPGWAEDYKYAHLMHSGPLLTHCSVYHPDYVKTVMARAGDGLLTSAGPKWFRNRRLLTPGFHFEILKPYVRLFSESTNAMLTNWEELKSGSSIDVFHHTSLMTLDSMLKCALSQHTDCQTSFLCYFYHIIRLKYLQDEDGNGLTDAEIRDEVDTFMFEGHDTTASGLAWTLYCLARHPGHQDKCRREAQEVLQGGTEVTWDLLPSLRYITMCVKEAMRMFSPVPMIFRQLESPLTFPDGRTLPEGAEYDPLRFSPENSKDRHPYAFIPFAAGPRKTNDYIAAVHDLTDLTMKRGRTIYHRVDLIYALSSDGRNFLCYFYHIIRLKYLQDEDGNGLTDAEIRDEVDTFMFEGHDTTASGLAWTLYCLARHPGHQEKCRREAQEVLQGGTEVTWDLLPSLKYITMCVKEAMRMFSPVPMIFRQLESPLTFPDGRTLPEGARVVIGINTLHHNSHVWENHMEYDPLRFSPENSKDRHPYAFIPFAAGPRNCIGQHFAMNELKTAVALILQRFSLTTDDTLTEPIPVPKIIMRARKPGLFLKIKPLTA
uniref:Uncharacterized protein n=1 Tax=Branchiostoma floridae TaxID=7739 RepID=C3XRR4_BRAFL|eukprot:XP_002613373.1 hypothetical protein BRAFLDRAFT_68359 [Branchiostoma floridae]